MCLLATGCDTSPVAASVNGSEIKQTALNEQIRLETANKAYVDAFDRAVGSSQSGYTIQGDAPGTFSARFVAQVLGTMIAAEAVRQELASEGRQPSAAQLAAARSVDEILFGSLWLSFPQAFRDTQVADDADHALVEAAPSATVSADLVEAYQQYRKYFFSDVCVRTIAVASDGGAASAGYDRAEAITQQFNSEAASPALKAEEGTPQGGEVTCYDGASLEDQGAAMFDQVLKLAPGQAAQPQQTSFGYQVVEVDSRLEQPYGPAVEEALALGVTQAQNSADRAYDAIVSHAKVHVDPQYGTWNHKDLAVVPSSPLGANSPTASSQSGA
jgi:hypothetical protein